MFTRHAKNVVDQRLNICWSREFSCAEPRWYCVGSWQLIPHSVRCTNQCARSSGIIVVLLVRLALTELAGTLSQRSFP